MKDHPFAKDLLAGDMNETVTVEGTLVSQGGVKMAYFSSVTPQKR